MRFWSIGMWLLLTAGSLHAHFIWILPADKGDSARVVWNDPLEPDNVDERLDTIANAEVLLRHADGRVETLKWKQDKDVYRVTCHGTGLRTLVVLWNDDRDFKGGTLLTQVAKVYLADPAGKAPWPSQGSSWERLGLEIVPFPKRGVGVYQLLSRGQPVAKRVVIPEIPDETRELLSKMEQQEVSRRRQSDKDGLFTFKTPKPGLYGLRVPSVTVVEEGIHQGKKFTHRRYTSTLVIQVASFTPEEDTEAIFKDAVKLMNQRTDVLKPVQDKASAAGAVPKLKLINERLADLKKKELNTHRLPPEQNRQLFAKHKASIEAAIKALGTEVARIEKLLEAKAALATELNLFEETSNTMLIMKQARASAARVQIKAIDKALQFYKLRTGKFPDALMRLTEGKNPPLRMKDLRDPWERHYLYDTSGAHNDGKMPDVWTMTPEQEIIGNWEKEK